MESLKMPMREIEAKYTTSELAIMAWRGSEMGFNMRARTQEVPRGHIGPLNPTTVTPDPLDYFEYDPPERDLRVIDEKLEPIAHKMVNEQGEIDLRRLTGAEALRYMGALGISVGGRV
jgi:hypothetical protein